jgi:hypothetical protein
VFLHGVIFFESSNLSGKWTLENRIFCVENEKYRFFAEQMKKYFNGKKTNAMLLLFSPEFILLPNF